jgi:hypothetical protein
MTINLEGDPKQKELLKQSAQKKIRLKIQDLEG